MALNLPPNLYKVCLGDKKKGDQYGGIKDKGEVRPQSTIRTNVIVQKGRYVPLKCAFSRWCLDKKTSTYFLKTF